MLGTPQGGLNYAYANQTVDQAIAGKIGTTTRFKSLHVGVASTDTSDADFGAVAKSIPHNGPNSPNLPEYDPVALYDRVFGDGFSTGPTNKSRRGDHRDAQERPRSRSRPMPRRSKMRLGATDGRDSTSTCRGYSSSRSSSWACVRCRTGGCTKPTNPAASYPAIDNEQIQWEPLSAAQTELSVYALACDQTRVFTYRFSPCNDYTVYPGFPTFKIDPTTTNTGTSMHGFTHTEGGDQPNVQKCLTFSISKFAKLLERLMAMSEGAGKLLDNCAIFAFTECTEGRSHNARTSPGSR